jgi:hypothetical protein
MAVTIRSATPRKLWRAFSAAIDAGEIVTWSQDREGDVTHVPAQWVKTAWFRPVFKDDRLVLAIVAPRGGMTSATYAVYHGRIIEAFLAHFDDQFSAISASAQPSADDLI